MGHDRERSGRLLIRPARWAESAPAYLLDGQIPSKAPKRSQTVHESRRGGRSAPRLCQPAPGQPPLPNHRRFRTARRDAPTSHAEPFASIRHRQPDAADHAKSRAPAKNLHRHQRRRPHRQTTRRLTPDPRDQRHPTTAHPSRGREDTGTDPDRRLDMTSLEKPIKRLQPSR